MRRLRVWVLAYSLGDPDMLVIWEAPFGDFANGAQVYFDQFIASAEMKWKRFSGLTLLLPHGYEGQGPEHSSGRPERFLQLCAGNNMQVVYPTTPAQIFHVLRRQMKRDFRKPLIVLTPKSLLRHPSAVSRATDMIEGHFKLVIDDPAVTDPATIRRILLCSGKVYYDLVEHRGQGGHDDVAVVRLEQLYPLAVEELQAVLARYDADVELVWVQEEPRNMGAFRFLKTTLWEQLDIDPLYVGRDENASPAVASMKLHLQEQHRIMINAIGRVELSRSGMNARSSSGTGRGVASLKYAHGRDSLRVRLYVSASPGHDGLALEKLGHVDEAIEEYGRAVEANPDDPAAQRAARRLAQLRTQKVRSLRRNLGRRVERWSTLS